MNNTIQKIMKNIRNIRFYNPKSTKNIQSHNPKNTQIIKNIRFYNPEDTSLNITGFRNQQTGSDLLNAKLGTQSGHDNPGKPNNIYITAAKFPIKVKDDNNQLISNNLLDALTTNDEDKINGYITKKVFTEDFINLAMHLFDFDNGLKIPSVFDIIFKSFNPDRTGQNNNIKPEAIKALCKAVKARLENEKIQLEKTAYFCANKKHAEKNLIESITLAECVINLLNLSENTSNAESSSDAEKIATLGRGVNKVNDLIEYFRLQRKGGGKEMDNRNTLHRLITFGAREIFSDLGGVGAEFISWVDHDHGNASDPASIAGSILVQAATGISNLLASKEKNNDLIRLKIRVLKHTLKMQLFKYIKAGGKLDPNQEEAVFKTLGIENSTSIRNFLNKKCRKGKTSSQHDFEEIKKEIKRITKSNLNNSVSQDNPEVDQSSQHDFEEIKRKSNLNNSVSQDNPEVDQSSQNNIIKSIRELKNIIKPLLKGENVYRIMSKKEFDNAIYKKDGIYKVTGENNNIAYYQVFEGTKTVIKLKEDQTAKINKLKDNQIISENKVKELFLKAENNYQRLLKYINNLRPEEAAKVARFTLTINGRKGNLLSHLISLATESSEIKAIEAAVKQANKNLSTPDEYIETLNKIEKEKNNIPNNADIYNALKKVQQIHLEQPLETEIGKLDYINLRMWLENYIKTIPRLNVYDVMPDILSINLGIMHNSSLNQKQKVDLICLIQSEAAKKADGPFKNTLIYGPKILAKCLMFGSFQAFNLKSAITLTATASGAAKHLTNLLSVFGSALGWLLYAITSPIINYVSEGHGFSTSVYKNVEDSIQPLTIALMQALPPAPPNLNQAQPNQEVIPGKIKDELDNKNYNKILDTLNNQNPDSALSILGVTQQQINSTNCLFISIYKSFEDGRTLENFLRGLNSELRYKLCKQLQEQHTNFAVDNVQEKELKLKALIEKIITLNDNINASNINYKEIIENLEYLTPDNCVTVLKKISVQQEPPADNEIINQEKLKLTANKINKFYENLPTRHEAANHIDLLLSSLDKLDSSLCFALLTYIDQEKSGADLSKPDSKSVINILYQYANNIQRAKIRDLWNKVINDNITKIPEIQIANGKAEITITIGNINYDLIDIADHLKPELGYTLLTNKKEGRVSVLEKIFNSDYHQNKLLFLKQIDSKLRHKILNPKMTDPTNANPTDNNPENNETLSKQSEYSNYTVVEATAEIESCLKNPNKTEGIETIIVILENLDPAIRHATLANQLNGRIVLDKIIQALEIDPDNIFKDIWKNLSQAPQDDNEANKDYIRNIRNIRRITELWREGVYAKHLASENRQWFIEHGICNTENFRNMSADIYKEWLNNRNFRDRKDALLGYYEDLALINFDDYYLINDNGQRVPNLEDKQNQANAEKLKYFAGIIARAENDPTSVWGTLRKRSDTSKLFAQMKCRGAAAFLWGAASAVVIAVVLGTIHVSLPLTALLAIGVVILILCDVNRAACYSYANTLTHTNTEEFERTRKMLDFFPSNIKDKFANELKGMHKKMHHDNLVELVKAGRKWYKTGEKALLIPNKKDSNKPENIPENIQQYLDRLYDEDNRSYINKLNSNPIFTSFTEIIEDITSKSRADKYLADEANLRIIQIILKSNLDWVKKSDLLAYYTYLYNTRSLLLSQIESKERDGFSVINKKGALARGAIIAAGSIATIAGAPVVAAGLVAGVADFTNVSVLGMFPESGEGKNTEGFQLNMSALKLALIYAYEAKANNVTKEQVERIRKQTEHFLNIRTSRNGFVDDGETNSLRKFRQLHRITQNNDDGKTNSLRKFRQLHRSTYSDGLALTPQSSLTP